MRSCMLALSQSRCHADNDVLVVGAGNIGAEIAADLSENSAGGSACRCVHRRTSFHGRSDRSHHADRGPDEYFPAWLVDPSTGCCSDGSWAILTRLRASRAALRSRRSGAATGLAPTIDVGLVAALRAGRVTPVAAVEPFDEERRSLVDGTVHPDAVIAAFGSAGLASLVATSACSISTDIRWSAHQDAAFARARDSRAHESPERPAAPIGLDAPGRSQGSSRRAPDG